MADFWNGRTYLGDFTSNILLFMPLGWELWLMRSKATQAQVPPLGYPSMLSATVEGLQLLLRAGR
ncbi:MAG: hypothetical protein HC857_02700 [Synechococcales cyanobacterium RU_4_20]|nr:hypothetical protein [Synechococcales cyanobacterium RU_4_20]